MYKLIATDCDGTILNSKGYLPKEIIDTFKVLHNKGIHILLATGRKRYFSQRLSWRTWYRLPCCRL